MPGLYLGAQAGARSSIGTGNGSAPSTASQAAFGPGYSGSSPSTANALAPNDPFGIALWSAVIAAGLLILIRHSLPG